MSTIPNVHRVTSEVRTLNPELLVLCKKIPVGLTPEENKALDQIYASLPPEEETESRLHPAQSVNFHE